MTGVEVGVGVAVGGAAASGGGAATAAALAAAAAASSAATAAAIGAFASSILTNLAISIGLSLISRLLTPKPNTIGRQQSVDRGITQLIRASSEPHKFMYGAHPVSGTMVFATTTGNDNKFLHMVIALAGHQSREITTVWIGDHGIDPDDLDATGDVTSGRFFHEGQEFVRIRKHLGEDNQLADSLLVSDITEWTTAHRLRGITYLYVRLNFNRELFPTGIPNVKALVKGRLIADPRDTAITISTSSVANPTTIKTASAHGVTANGRVFIDGHTGSTPSISGEYHVISTPATDELTIDVNVSVGGTGGSLLKMKWSDNSALVVRDYMLGEFGLNAEQTDEMDDTLAKSAATICDEEVNLPAAVATVDFTADNANNRFSQVIPEGDKELPLHSLDGVEASTTGTLPTGLSGSPTRLFVVSISGKDVGTGGVPLASFKLATSLVNARAGVAISISTDGTGTHTLTRKSQPRYTTNGALALDERPIEIIPNLIIPMAGKLSYTQGLYSMYAGAFISPVTLTLNDDDLRGRLNIRPRPGRLDLYNSVRGTFTDRDNGYQLTDFPPVINATFITRDQEEKIFKDISLPFVTDTYRAQRLARLTNQRAREGLIIDFPARMHAIELAVGETVQVTSTIPDWTNKEFEIITWTFAEGGGIDLVMQETASAIYSYDPDNDAQIPNIAPNTNLPNAFDLPSPPTGLVLTSGTNELLLSAEGSIISRIKASWTAPVDIFVTSGGTIELQMKLNSDSVWETLLRVPGDETIGFLTPIEDGLAYDVRIRGVNSLGVASDFETVLNHTVVGKTAAPPDVDTFSVARLADGTRRLEWTLSPLPDDVRAGGGYRIRYQSGGSITWASAISLHDGLLISSPFETNELASGQFTFGIKAIDSSGNESTNELAFTVTLGDPRLREVLLQRIEQSLPWTGTLTDCFITPENTLEAVFSGTPAAD